jgi:hypothetical protein
MNEQEREQNKKINEHNRKIANLQQRLKTIELDVEPKGRISSSFEAIEEDLAVRPLGGFLRLGMRTKTDEIKSRISRLEQNSEHRFNRLDAKLEVIIDHLTGISDLPEE